MGFYIRNRENPVLVAQELLESITANRMIKSRKGKKIVKEAAFNKKEILKKAIQLVENPTSAKELYIVSGAYSLLGNEYSRQAIKYLEKYIAVGACFEETPQDTVEVDGVMINQKDANVSSVYFCLGRAYEQEKDKAKAIENYEKALALFTYNPSYYVCLGRLYKKDHKHDQYTQLVQQAKKSSAYQTNDFFKAIIDENF